MKIKIDSNGYLRLKLPDHPDADINGYIYQHRWLAEKVLNKPLSPGIVIHHHTPTEIVICENQGYHNLIHRRQKSLKECGHAHWRKCIFCKIWDDPKNNMYISIDGNLSCHRECRRIYERNKR